MQKIRALAIALLVTACGSDARDLPAAAVGPTVHLTLAHVFPALPSVGRDLAFSPGDSLLATSSADGTLELWRLADLRRARAITVPGGIASLGFSPDGAQLATGGYDGTVRQWRVADGTLVRTITAHTGTAWSVVYSPDGTRLASSGEDRLVKLWQTSDGTAIRSLAGHTLNVWQVAFSPDGHVLASGSFDRSIRLWDAESGTPRDTLLGHGEAVVAVAFSPDGTLLASGSDDATTRLWRSGDGALVRVLPVGNHVYCVAFSPDGRWLATAGRARGALGTFWHQVAGDRFSGAAAPVRLWRLSDGALLQVLGGHTDDVQFVAFSRGGRWLATSSEDHRIRLWRVDANDLALRGTGW